jgi:hypothetical protein
MLSPSSTFVNAVHRSEFHHYHSQHAQARFIHACSCRQLFLPWHAAQCTAADTACWLCCCLSPPTMIDVLGMRAWSLQRSSTTAMSDTLLLGYAD